jgi:hypothetical protein
VRGQINLPVCRTGLTTVPVDMGYHVLLCIGDWRAGLGEGWEKWELFVLDQEQDITVVRFCVCVCVCVCVFIFKVPRRETLNRWQTGWQDI